MIKNNILTFLVFILFVFGYFTNPEFWPNLKKIALNTRCRKYPKRKSWKTKNVKMFLFITCEAPKNNSTIFRPFLAIFTLFHLTNWPYLQKPQLGNLGETRFWLLLVNNQLCSIPLSFARSEIKEIAVDRCAYAYILHPTWDFHLQSEFNWFLVPGSEMRFDVFWDNWTKWKYAEMCRSSQMSHSK